MKNKVFVFSFIIFLIIPTLCFAFDNENISVVSIENREKTQMPTFSIQTIESFPRDFDAFYSDNIPFRDQLININNSIDYNLFDASSSDSVLIGNNGYLFYKDNDDYNPLNQSLGLWMYTDEEMKQIAEKLNNINRVCESQGIDFVFFVAPNKETIYQNEMPDYIERISEYTSTDQLIDYLKEKTDLTIIYPKSEMLSAVDEYQEYDFYYKLDTHWNALGAYIGTQELCKSLDIIMPDINKMTISTAETSTGDLTKLLHVNTGYTDKIYKFEDYGEFSNNENNEKSIAFVHDSFGVLVKPILSEEFSKIFSTHKSDFTFQMIFDEDVDIFVLESVERYLPSFLRKEMVSFLSYYTADDNSLVIYPTLKCKNIPTINVTKIVDNQEIKLIDNYKFADSLTIDIVEGKAEIIKIEVFVNEWSNEPIETVEINY